MMTRASERLKPADEILFAALVLLVQLKCVANNGYHLLLYSASTTTPTTAVASAAGAVVLLIALAVYACSSTIRIGSLVNDRYELGRDVLATRPPPLSLSSRFHQQQQQQQQQRHHQRQRKRCCHWLNVHLWRRVSHVWDCVPWSNVAHLVSACILLSARIVRLFVVDKLARHGPTDSRVIASLYTSEFDTLLWPSASALLAQTGGANNATQSVRRALSLGTESSSSSSSGDHLMVSLELFNYLAAVLLLAAQNVTLFWHLSRSYALVVLLHTLFYSLLGASSFASLELLFKYETWWSAMDSLRRSTDQPSTTTTPSVTLTSPFTLCILQIFTASVYFASLVPFYSYGIRQ